MPSVEVDQKLETPKLQSRERQLVAARMMARIQTMESMRNQKFAYFRNRTPAQMIEDSIKRLAQYKVKPVYKQWWQANLPGSFISDKLFQFLSKLAARSMEAQVFCADELSFVAKMKERVMNTLLKAAGRKNQDDFQLVMEMLEAMGKGTVVGFEGWKHARRKVRVVMDEDL